MDARIEDWTAKQTVWSTLLRGIILPAGDHLLQWQMMRRLHFLEQAQWWPHERLVQNRDAALRAALRTAYEEVPLYGDLMRQSGVRPEDIHSASDLQKLPVVTKEMLRAGYPGRSTRRTGFRTVETYTSGSTGKNLRILEDAYTEGWYRASFMLALEWAGWRFGEPHLQTGMGLERNLPRRLKDLLLRCHYISAADLSDSALDAALGIIADRRLRYVMGYPGSLYYLARRARDLGWNQPLVAVVTWGDNLFPHYREMIETVFQTRVFDTYGCAEGIQVAAQCEHGSYHIHTLDVVVEFVDDMGFPVGEGQPGNLLLTRLHPGAMPFIRYQVGDLGIAGPTEPCDCGRTFDRLASIQGRNTDVIVTPDGNRLIVHFFTGILEYFPEIDCFQVVQDDPQEVVVRLVPAQEIAPGLLERIEGVLRNRGMGDMRISMELVDEIPLPPSGKRRFVINNLRRANLS